MTTREMKINNLHKQYNEEIARITAMPAEQAKAEYMEAHKAAYESALEQANRMYDMLENAEIKIIQPDKQEYEWLIPAVCGLVFGLGVILGLNL